MRINPFYSTLGLSSEVGSDHSRLKARAELLERAQGKGGGRSPSRGGTAPGDGWVGTQRAGDTVALSIRTDPSGPFPVSSPSGFFCW